MTKTQIVTNGSISRTVKDCSGDFHAAGMDVNVPLRRRRPAGVMLGLATLTVIATITSVSALSLPRNKVRNVLHGVGIGSSVHVPSAIDPTHTSVTGTSGTSDSRLHMISNVNDEKKSLSEQEFEMHVGKALDTLRADYPDILTEHPDFTIYDQDLEVVDPSGVKVHGINSYKNAFRLINGIVKVLYCPTKSLITFRMCYDQARHAIRIHWNARVVPREIFGGARTTLYVDGISCYEMDRKTGKITQHRIEQLLMNNDPVRPKGGVIAALQREAGSVPSFITNSPGGSSMHIGSNSSSIVMEFQPIDPIKALFKGPNSRQLPSSLFAMEASGGSNSNSDSDAESPDFDYESFNSKNKSRKKFGLKALTEQEFLELEAAVEEMGTQQEQKRAIAAASAAEMSKKKNKKAGFLENLFGNVMQDTCESNYDCLRPEVCCDFGFKKMCCSSGQMIIDGLRPPQMQPVRVIAGWKPGQGPPPESY
jgi:hypothetical protein